MLCNRLKCQVQQRALLLPGDCSTPPLVSSFPANLPSSQLGDGSIRKPSPDHISEVPHQLAQQVQNMEDPDTTSNVQIIGCCRGWLLGEPQTQNRQGRIDRENEESNHQIRCGCISPPLTAGPPWPSREFVFFQGGLTWAWTLTTSLPSSLFGFLLSTSPNLCIGTPTPDAKMCCMILSGRLHISTFFAGDGHTVLVLSMWHHTNLQNSLACCTFEAGHTASSDLLAGCQIGNPSSNWSNISFWGLFLSLTPNPQPQPTIWIDFRSQSTTLDPQLQPRAHNHNHNAPHPKSKHRFLGSPIGDFLCPANAGEPSPRVETSQGSVLFCPPKWRG